MLKKVSWLQVPFRALQQPVHLSPVLSTSIQILPKSALFSTSCFVISLTSIATSSPVSVSQQTQSQSDFPFKSGRTSWVLPSIIICVPYFSLIPIDPEKINIRQYNKLLKFKELCEKEGLVFSYKSIDDLREKLQRHITTTINSLQSSYGYSYS